LVEKRREQRSRVGNGNHGRSLNHRERRLLYGQGTCRPIWEEPARLPSGLKSLDTRVGLIQASIPLGLLAVEAVLQREVELLAGPRYARKDGAPNRVRWRRQRGSVYLLDHKVPVQVPRMRGRRLGVEVPLESYRRAAAAPGGGGGDAAAQLPGLPGRRGSGAGSLWAPPLQRVPAIHPASSILATSHSPRRASSAPVHTRELLASIFILPDELGRRGDQEPRPYRHPEGKPSH